MTKVEMEVEASLPQSLEELLLRSERLITSCLYYVILKVFLEYKNQLIREALSPSTVRPYSQSSFLIDINKI